MIKSKQQYFTESTEQSIFDYVTSTGRTREFIYNSILHPAFVQMTESIIRKYYFNIDEDDFGEIKFGAISHLVSKLLKFNKSKGKAFSYCQTIIKNYCNDWLKFRGQRNAKFIVYDHDDLIDQFDRPDVDSIDPIDSIFHFIDYLLTTTGNSTTCTPLSIQFIDELKKIKNCAITAGMEYDTSKITVFYKKIFTDKSQGWSACNTLKELYKNYLKNIN